jgi:hypothetical protein
LFRVLNNACASALGLDPGAGVAGTVVPGGSAGRDELDAGAGAEDEVASGAGTVEERGPVEVCRTGTTPTADGWYGVGLTPGDAGPDDRAVVRGALGRLSWVVLPAAWDAGPDWLSGSRIAPANVSGRRPPSELAMATTATALMAVAATDSHSAGA